MVGEGALIECLNRPEVEQVLVIDVDFQYRWSRTRSGTSAGTVILNRA